MAFLDPVAKMAQPLRNRQFAAYALALVISSAGTYAATVALSFGVIDAFDPASLALVLLAREIPIVVLVLMGGVISDRASRRLVLGSTSLVQAGSQLGSAALLGGVTDPGTSTLVLLMACAAVHGGATAFARPTMSGIVPEIASPGEYQAANALLGSLPRAVGIGGAALGALLVGTVGAAWGLVFDSATFLMAATLFWTMSAAHRPRQNSTGVLSSFFEGWRTVRGNQWIWAMIASFSLFQVAYFPTIAVLGPALSRSAYGGADAWAVILSGGLVGALAGIGISGLIHPKSPLAVASLVGGASALQIWALAAGLGLTLVFGLSVISGIGLTVGDTLWHTVLQYNVDTKQLSRVSSFDWLASLTLNPLGYAVIAPLAAMIGTSQTLWLSGCILLVAVSAPLFSLQVWTLKLPTPAGVTDV